jgi:formylglycine-generating enzyme required for sulfatase activity
MALLERGFWRSLRDAYISRVTAGRIPLSRDASGGILDAMRIRHSLLIILLLSGCAGVGVAVKPVPLVGENLPPGIDPALWKTVDTLVARLGDDDYSTREAAQKEIEALPASALEAVKASVERRSKDKEIKWRGEKAVAALTDKAFWEKAPKEFTNAIGMKLVLIPAGEFLMGSPADEKDRSNDETQHKVRITKPFYMGTTEVTQAQWKAVMGNNPSQFQGDNLPVETVSWNDCQEFLKKLSAKEGKTYWLPTEAEWEYACRAGTNSRFSFGNDDGDLHKYGNYCDKSNTNGFDWQDKEHDDGHDKTAPVGSYKPNSWGLYDMHGNVWEWCQDLYVEDYYKSSPAADPTGPTQSAFRVLRGGCWTFFPRLCRSSSRRRIDPDYRGSSIGFRVVVVSSSRTP